MPETFQPLTSADLVDQLAHRYLRFLIVLMWSYIVAQAAFHSFYFDK